MECGGWWLSPCFAVYACVAVCLAGSRATDVLPRGVRAVAALSRRRGGSSIAAPSEAGAEAPAAGDAPVASDWQEVVHEETGQTYYYNSATGETSWEKPV